jgi:CPA2 family monovalent cation:H+ antiporter-2
VPTSGGGAFLAGNDLRTSMRAGMGLAQIGEFSFIILQLGLTLGVISDFLYPIVVSVSAITTLLTPYLIRASDRTVSVFERAAPRGFVALLDTYHGWVDGFRHGARDAGQVRRLVRKWILQVLLNVALISGILIGATSLARWTERQGVAWTALPRWIGGTRAVIWLAAMLLALPLLVATFRKLRAMTQVLAELTITRSESRDQVATTRMVVANAILIPAMLAIAAWIIVLSAALLPPWPVLVVLLLIIGAVTAVMWNRFVKMYATAQIALRETLSEELAQTTSSASPPDLTPLHPALADAHTEMLTIDSASPAAGKLIRELQLRTATGASAVAIERNGSSVINPGPDEELLVGDRVLLLGDERQLEAARQLILPARSG